MNHPELFLVPILMLADYALTILGAKTSIAVYRNHFVMGSYELNPVWRKSVDQIRWFNARHLIVVALITILLCMADLGLAILDPDLATLELDALALILGILLGAFGTVCGRHLTNLLLFRYLNRNPQEISGQVYLSMILTLKLSQFQSIGLVPLSIIVAVLVPNSYTVGVSIGLIALVFAHFVWARNLKVTPPTTKQ